MAEKFQARYEVDDGYVCGARPHHFKISANELEEDMSDEDLRKFYWDEVQANFEERITPCAERVDEFIAWAREQLNARKP